MRPEKSLPERYSRRWFAQGLIAALRNVQATLRKGEIGMR